MRKILLLMAAVLSAGLAFAQNVQVTGIATSAEDGEPMPAVAVAIQGTGRGTTTDLNGAYSISVPSDGTLVFSFMGYNDAVVPVNGRKVINVELQPGEIMIDDVVITAMGISREKKALGYAVQDIKSDELVSAANTSLGSALQGKVSGIDITPSSGMPGASSKIVIRGARSFDGNNTPLYVVDGMPIASTPDVDTGESVIGSDYSSRALDIDPNDIESVNILKGQAASALYGMRASNGVIIITTKKGKHNSKAMVTVNSSISADRVSVLPKFQTKYAQGSYDEDLGQAVYDPNTSLSWGPLISELPNDPVYGGNTDNKYTQEYGKQPGKYYVPQLASAGLNPWVEPGSYNNARNFFRIGWTQSNSVSVTKGIDGGSFALSLGNTKSEGIVPGTGYERYNARMSADTKLSNAFTAGFSGNFVASKLKKSTGANDGIVATIYGCPPSYDLMNMPTHELNNPYSQINYRGTTFFDNAIWSTENNEHSERTQRFFGDAFVQYENRFNSADKKLTLKYQLGEDAYSSTYADNWGYGHNNAKGGADEYAYQINETNSLFTANFDWKINNDINFNALYGNEVVFATRKFIRTYGTSGFNFKGWNHVNNLSSYQGEASFGRSLTFGNFASLSADFHEMLFLNVTGRIDRVSSMPNGSRTYFYPSVSAGFVFTELEPLRNDVLTFGKVRGSYAEVGASGEYVPSYYEVPEYGTGFSNGTPVAYPINGTVAFTRSSTIYDENLRPQNTMSYEFGLDLGFFDGRISLSYTFSRQNVKDQIFKVPMPSSTGYNKKLTNAGKIHTNAHEATIGFIPIQKKNLEWNIDVNFTKIDNYVDELAEGVESIYLGGFTEPQIRAGIGEKFPVIYGVSFLRNENGDIVVDEDGMPQAGEEKVLGQVSPDFQMGFSTGVTWKRLSFNAVLDWKQGGYMYCGTDYNLDYYGTSQRSVDYRETDQFLFEKSAVKEVFDDEGNVTGYAPNDIMISGSDASAYMDALCNISEAAIHETSYLKVRELSLSYKLIQKPKVSLSVNAFARNLILWSTLKGYDPEASQGNNNMGGGFERFSLPGTSSFGGGLTLNF